MLAELLPIMAVSVALLIGAISPGQTLVPAGRTSVASLRRVGLAAAPGLGVGNAVFAVIALSSLHSILMTVPWRYLLPKHRGG